MCNAPCGWTFETVWDSKVPGPTLPVSKRASLLLVVHFLPGKRFHERHERSAAASTWRRNAQDVRSFSSEMKPRTPRAKCSRTCLGTQPVGCVFQNERSSSVNTQTALTRRRVPPRFSPRARKLPPAQTSSPTSPQDGTGPAAKCRAPHPVPVSVAAVASWTAIATMADQRARSAALRSTTPTGAVGQSGPGQPLGASGS